MKSAAFWMPNMNAGHTCIVAADTTERKSNRFYSLAHKLNFAGHVIIATGLRTMHFPLPGIILRCRLEPVAG